MHRSSVAARSWLMRRVHLRSTVASVRAAVATRLLTSPPRIWPIARPLHTRASLKAAAPPSSPEVQGNADLWRSLLHKPSPRPGQYAALHRASLQRPDEFWLAAADHIRWSSKGSRALTPAPKGSPSQYRWFGDDDWKPASPPLSSEQIAKTPLPKPEPGRWTLNACDNMLDVHVERGFGDRTAIIYDSAVTGQVQRFSYKEMLQQVSKLAGALRHAGVTPGDRVLLYMPMVPETMAGMMACARLGAVHACVFGGFAANELAKRIRDAKPTVILTASCGLESATKIIPYKPALDEAIALSGHTPRKVLVLQRPQCKAELVKGRDEDWAEYVQEHGQNVDPVPVPAAHPLYILYTSGTTGSPKGVVRDTGSITALRASMSSIFGVSPPIKDAQESDVFWTAADLGWAVGHSFGLYAPLLAGVTTVLYEGKPVGTPDAGAFWRVVQQHKVKVLFTAPTALRAIRKEDNAGELARKYDTSSLEALYLAGERADPSSSEWASSLLGVPVIDNYWQTETGWPIAASPRGVETFPTRAGSCSFPQAGWDVRVLDDAGNEVARGVQGNIVLQLPLAPGGVQELWQSPVRFEKSYISRFPGFYDTSDAGLFDEQGYLSVMARTDDVMNIAGHRLSSGQLEEVLSSHPSIAECAAIAVPDELRGHVPVGIVVLKSGLGGQGANAADGNEKQAASDPKVIEAECVAAVRARVGAVACFKRVIVVPRLPKTRSGKLLRNVLRAMAAGEQNIPVPPTIEDASVLEEVQAHMRKQGIGILQSKN